MIRINLPKPLFIDDQAVEIAGKLDVSPEDITDLLKNRKIFYAGKLMEKKDEDLSERGAKNEDYFYASDAIVEMSRIKGVDLTPFTEIVVPKEVLFECNALEWLDLSRLAARIENRAIRFEKLSVLQTPQVIIENEERLMKDAIVVLEHNHLTNSKGELLQVTDADGRAFCSLRDIGYSLLTGWNDEARKLHKKNSVTPKQNEEQDF